MGRSPSHLHEHPHNATLLICSSHEKGCRPFMCDTAHARSNCFDQLCKSITSRPPRLVCPLCRGAVTSQEVIEPARKLMNAKPRGCCHESCDFTGTYDDLCEHAITTHPLTAEEAQAKRRHERLIAKICLVSTIGPSAVSEVHRLLQSGSSIYEALSGSINKFLGDDDNGNETTRRRVRRRLNGDEWGDV